MDEQLAAQVWRNHRAVMLSYVIFAVFVVAGVWINFTQTQNNRETETALAHDTASLARAIANGQTYLCGQILALEVEHHETVRIRCLSQEQRYNQIISSLESH